MALWGTGYEKARAYIEIEHRHKIIKSFWTERGATQQPVKLAITEAMRGGCTLRVTMVRENRAYLTSRHVDVPWTNKELKIKWEHFVSKLEPAAKETWTAVITGPNAKKAVAEMVATLYDQSLDAYLPHPWMKAFGVFRQDHSNLQSQFENTALYLQQMLGNWPTDYQAVSITYRHFPNDIVSPFWGMYGIGFGGMPGGRGGMRMAKGMQAMEQDGAMNGGPWRRRPRHSRIGRRGWPATAERSCVPTSKWKKGNRAKAPVRAPPANRRAPISSNVSARQNLQETVFFFPHLISDEEGRVKLEFTMPEALTQWRSWASLTTPRSAAAISKTKW